MAFAGYDLFASCCISAKLHRFMMSRMPCFRNTVYLCLWGEWKTIDRRDPLAAGHKGTEPSIRYIVLLQSSGHCTCKDCHLPSCMHAALGSRIWQMCCHCTCIAHCTSCTHVQGRGAKPWVVSAASFCICTPKAATQHRNNRH